MDFLPKAALRQSLLGAIAICALAAFALLFGQAAPAAAKAGKSASAGSSSLGTKASGKRGKARKAAKKAAKRKALRKRAKRIRHLRQRKLRRNRNARLSGNVAVSRPRTQTPAPISSSSSGVIDAGFENGLFNWNTAGVGDAIPAVTGDIVRSGVGAGSFTLSGSQDRSELILGGNGGGSANDAVLFREGAEHFYAFSFYIESMVYGRPGGHNLIMQLKGDDSGSPNFALQLWDYEGDNGDDGGRGLWSHGDAMDGDRFLAPVPERQWHDVVVHFRASAGGAGLYEVFLNGQLIDARGGVSTIPSGADHVYVKSGLYRNGSSTPGTSRLRLDAVRLGPSMAAVLPG